MPILTLNMLNPSESSGSMAWKYKKNVTVVSLGVQVFLGKNSKRNWIRCKNDSSYLKIFELKKWANSEFWHVIDISR